MNNDINNMKRIIFFLFYLFSSVVLCQGQLLWKVSGNGAKESYLLGSMHIVSFSFCDSLAHFNDVFSSVNVVYGECVMIPDSTRLSSNDVQSLFLPSGQGLKNYYTEEEFETVLDYCQSAFLSRPHNINFSPIGLVDATTRFVARQSSPLYAEGQQSLDYALQIVANNLGMPVKGLEPFEETISFSSKVSKEILSGESLEEQSRSLLNYIQSPENHPDTVRRVYSSIFEAYASQDLLKLETVLSAIAPTALGKELLLGRNENWIPSIIEAINHDNTLFVVGVGHLIGPVGLIQLIIERGYNVVPIQ